MNWILFLAFCISIQKLDFFILNFGKSKLEKFILTPKSGQGQDIPSYLTRERKFLISLSCMRIYRLTRKWHISWKIWHFMKWFIRTKQIHLCLGLHTCKENYPCGTDSQKIRFLTVLLNYFNLFRVNKKSLWYLPCYKWSRRRTVGILDSWIWSFKDWSIVVYILDVYDHFGFDMLTGSISSNQPCIISFLWFPFVYFRK